MYRLILALYNIQNINFFFPPWCSHSKFVLTNCLIFFVPVLVHRCGTDCIAISLELVTAYDGICYNIAPMRGLSTLVCDRPWWGRHVSASALSFSLSFLRVHHWYKNIPDTRLLLSLLDSHIYYRLQLPCSERKQRYLLDIFSWNVYWNKYFLSVQIYCLANYFL